MKKTIIPPIKSQGIKTKLVPWIFHLAPKVKGRWIEPFLGTGVVAFNSGYKKALLNEINPYIINVYKSIQNKKITPDIVRSYLNEEGEKLRHSEDEGYAHYRFVKDRFNKEHNPLDFIFLSRAGFNGMMRFNKKGDWNLPFCKKPNRFTKAYITKIVNQVEAVSLVIQDEWEFTVEDFKETIKKANKDDIIYCDPPYIHRYVDYYSGWEEKDEHELYKSLSKTKAKFILSTWHHNDYRENIMIEKCWKEFNIVTRDHFYHGGGKIENRKSIVEALVFNFDSNIDNHNHDLNNKSKNGIQSKLDLEYIS